MKLQTDILDSTRGEQASADVSLSLVLDQNSSSACDVAYLIDLFSGVSPPVSCNIVYLSDLFSVTEVRNMGVHILI